MDYSYVRNLLNTLAKPIADPYHSSSRQIACPFHSSSRLIAITDANEKTISQRPRWVACNSKKTPRSIHRAVATVILSVYCSNRSM